LQKIGGGISTQTDNTIVPFERDFELENNISYSKVNFLNQI